MFIYHYREMGYPIGIATLVSWLWQFRHMSDGFKSITCSNFFFYGPTCNEGTAIGNSDGSTYRIIPWA